MTFRSLRVSALIAAGAALAAASSAAPPDGSGPAACPAIDPSSASSATRAGSALATADMHVAVDPATGAPRALTPEERQTLSARRAAAKAEALRNVRIVTHANGMTTADLADAFLMNVVAETHPDGTVTYRCVPAAKPAPARELK
jgi:hypothetical protein